MRLLGNTVLLEPFDAEVWQSSASNLFIVNHYKKSTLAFKVLAVGPGEWRRKKRKPAVFIKPEVVPGDLVICRAQLDPGVVKHSLDDGSGRIIVGADSLMLSWRE